MRFNDLAPVGDGEKYQDRFWPMNDPNIADLEAILGWALQDDYRSFLKKFGSSTPKTDQIFVTDSEEIPFSTFYGAALDARTQLPDLISRAPRYKDEGRAGFANALNGYFYLNREGHVLWQAPDMVPLEKIADSFTEFFEKLEPDPDGYREPKPPVYQVTEQDTDLAMKAIRRYRERNDEPLIHPYNEKPLKVVDLPEMGVLAVTAGEITLFTSRREPGTIIPRAEPTETR